MIVSEILEPLETIEQITQEDDIALDDTFLDVSSAEDDPVEPTFGED